MEWNLKNIRQAFGGRLIGNLSMRKWVCETVILLPSEIVEYVTKNIWFISSPEDAWAFTFRGSDVKNQHLIVLSDELFKQSEDDIRYTIIHEIGHVILNHKNSMGFMQTESEIKMQEREADNFARKYLD